MMFLQDAGVPGGPVDPECLGYGALISLLVSLVKGIPFIKKNPKTVSLIVSILWTAIPAVIRGGADFKVIAFCVLTQFSASVAFYEAGTRQVAKLRPDAKAKEEEKLVNKLDDLRSDTK